MPKNIPRVQNLSQIDADLFDRQKRVSGWDQTALSKARVLVAGAGALGNELVKNLVQLGVGKIALVDYDEIVPANLNRCVFFDVSDAEKKLLKANVLADKASRITSSTVIEPLICKVEDLPEDFYSNFDAAFGCLDNLGARLHLNANCYGKMPFIDGGTAGFFGKVQVARSPSSCIECAMGKNDYGILWKKYSCKGEMLDVMDPKMPAFSTTTSVVAALAANEFLKILFEKDKAFADGSLAGKYLFYNGLRATFEVFEVAKRADCPVHS